MFYSVNGTLCLCEPGIAVVEAGGVGYQLTVSLRDMGELSRKVGEKVLLYTHLSVREDGVELFGFSQKQELDIFRLLNTVSGVGPKAAMSILGSLSASDVVSAVLAGDAKGLSCAQGIGNKTAQRIILELKDKLAKSKTGDISSAPLAAAAPSRGSAVAEAVNALVVLGYSRQQASEALSGVDVTGKSVEALIREALKALSMK
ncbi:MAG: Holliday junction branch migration protein RuvA [Ruminococcaceae bacterium]|nr:Holliday junction branch migration protein RuvA [Oscillospiraceae bacterium]